jgi:hypothetical protein
MADPPPSDLGADTKENLQNRLTQQRFGMTTEYTYSFVDLGQADVHKPTFPRKGIILPMR